MNTRTLLSPIAATLVTLGACAWTSPAAAAPSLDPFAKRAPTKLTPFAWHVASAEEAPADEQRPAAPPAASQAESTPAQPSKPSAAEGTAQQPAKPSPTPAASVCSRDDQCPSGTICEDGRCKPFERAIDILLYRKDGRSTAFIPFYWSDRGNPGYRVFAPIYFHFWSPESRTRIVAPFYWRVEDHIKQRVVLVVPPYVQTWEPGAKSWAFWPLFYLSTKFGWAAPLLGSFKIGNPDQGKAFGMWFLLYYWSRTPESKFDLLFPFAISTRSKDSAFTYAVPLNFYWRRGQDANLLALPFFYRNTTPTGGTFASPLGYASIENRTTAGSFLWLYWYGRSKASSYDVLFPILWSFRSPGANTTILPPLFHFRSGQSSIGTFALLGWWSKDEKKGSSWQLALPLYFRKSSDFGAKTFHLWPTGSYRRDDTTGARYLTMLVPPILYWRDKQHAVDFELLYYRHHDIAADARTTVIGPYYRRRDPDGATTAVLPLFWHFRDAQSGATAHTFFPLYFRRNAPTEKMIAAGIFPAWFYYRSFSDGGSSGGLFPIAFFGKRKERSHAIVFPLLWHFRNPNASSTLLLPLFYASSSKSSSSLHLLPVLYFSGANERTSYRIQVPLFWHIEDKWQQTSTTLAPLYFRYGYKDGYAAGLWPLVFWGGGGARRHFAIFPLFWWFRDDAQDKTTTVVANYLHRRHGDETTDAFFPLLHYRRGRKPGGQDETSLTVFPLLHYRRSPASTVFVSPLAAWTRSPDRQAGIVGPYLWYRSQSMALRAVPLLYLDHTQLDTGKRTRQWGPVVAVDSPTLKSRTVVPFWSHFEKPNESGTWIFPTFLRWQKSDGYHLSTVFPFLWLSRSPTSHTTVAGPYFSHHCNDDRSAGLPPFYLSTDSKKRSLTVTPVWVAHTNHETRVRKVFSVLFYQSSKDQHLFRTVLPLWWQASDGNKSWAIGFPLYWHFANKEQSKSKTLVGPVYVAQDGTERTRGLLPLLWYSRDEGKQTSSNAFLPFFYERHGSEGRSFLTVLFGLHRTPNSRWWYLGPFVRRDTLRSHFHTFFPLWFYHRDHAAEQSTRVIPPLLHYARKSPERSLSTWLMLFWQRSDITSSSTFGLPLIYDLHAYHRSRLTMVLPLFVRYRNFISGQSYTVAPLFYRRSGPTDSTTVVFPLVWRFWSPERSTTVVFPFYFGVRRATSDTTYVFPNIYYRKGLGSEAGTSHLFVFPFWESRVKRPGDTMWEALLGLCGYERIGRNRYLKLFFIPFELEAAPASKTAWYGLPPKRAKERVARGVDVRAW